MRLFYLLIFNINDLFVLEVLFLFVHNLFLQFQSMLLPQLLFLLLKLFF